MPKRNKAWHWSAIDGPFDFLQLTFCESLPQVIGYMYLRNICTVIVSYDDLHSTLRNS
jgi:hypothetical protein